MNDGGVGVADHLDHLRRRHRRRSVVSDEFSMRWCDVYSLSSLRTRELEFQTNTKKWGQKLNIGQKERKVNKESATNVTECECFDGLDKRYVTSLTI